MALGAFSRRMPLSAKRWFPRRRLLSLRRPSLAQDKPKSRPRYIRWSDLLRRVFGIETVCQKCQVPLRLISLIKSEPIARKILVAMHLSADVPELHPARPPPRWDRDGRNAEDWVN